MNNEYTLGRSILTTPATAVYVSSTCRQQKDGRAMLNQKGWDQGVIDNHGNR